MHFDLNEEIVSSGKHVHAINTPLKPHFYLVKLGCAGVNLLFIFLLQNIDRGYSLEPDDCVFKFASLVRARDYFPLGAPPDKVLSIWHITINPFRFRDSDSDRF